MNNKKCAICGKKLVKNGKTRTGAQRGLCKSCKTSNVIKNKNDFYKFKRFLDGLFSKDSQIQLKISDRTFRLHNEEFGKYGPLPDYIDEIHDVIFCDGIYLRRNLVVLIACTKQYTLGGYLARSENSKSWSALLRKIAPPIMVVTDGGTGFRKAVSKIGPNTNVQRCTFHVAQQIRRYTTLRPKLEAGQELLLLSRLLTKVKTNEQKNNGKDKYIEGCIKGDEFLKEKTKNESGRYVFKHERLRKARRALNSVLSDDTLFTFLNPLIDSDEVLPATNNVIEGRVNAALRAMLRNHRGLSSVKRAKACFGGCYFDTEYKLSMSKMLENMATDEDIDRYYQSHSIDEQNNLSINRWGDGIVWNEFHCPTPYPFHYD